MKPFVVTLCALTLLAAPAWASPEPVTLKAEPHTPLDATARQVVAEDLAKAAGNGEAPLVLIGEARLGGPKDRPALFIQLQSARECGSAGCNTSVYLDRGKGWTKVLDSVGGAIRVDSTRHAGMRDLLVGGDGRWIWNGRMYADTRSAPNVKIKPKAH